MHEEFASRSRTDVHAIRMLAHRGIFFALLALQIDIKPHLLTRIIFLKNPHESRISAIQMTHFHMTLRSLQKSLMALKAVNFATSTQEFSAHMSYITSLIIPKFANVNLQR